MKWKWMTIVFFISALGCGSGGSGLSGTPNPDYTDLSYDVTAEATLNQVVQDLSSLSGVNFSIDPELQARLDDEPVDLPTLLGLKVGEVLTLLQNSMPPSTSYLYKEVGGGDILLIPNYQQAEDLSAASPVTFVDFDAALGGRLLVSDPRFEDECGGDETLVLLGDGPSGIISDATSDPDGYNDHQNGDNH